VPFEFENFSKLAHYITGGRWIFVTCKGGNCFHQRVLDLRRFDPEMTFAELKQKKFRCSKCGSTRVEVKREIEREWRRRIKR
jgi:hypothetical protein